MCEPGNPPGELPKVLVKMVPVHREMETTILQGPRHKATAVNGFLETPGLRYIHNHLKYEVENENCHK